MIFVNDTERSAARARLKELVMACMQRGDITLASGKKTDFYFDGRLVTLNPEGLELLSKIALEHIGERCDAVGGPTSGADPMVAGIGLAARQVGRSIQTFFVRKEKKDHGMQKSIEGPDLPAGAKVAIIDDTATSGGSLLRAAHAVQEFSEATPILALVLVDREEGAREKVEGAGLEFVTIFNRSELQ